MKIKLDEGARVPSRAYPTDAGLDVYAMHDGVVRAGNGATFKTGIHIELPPNCMGDIRPKSGLMFKHGILTFGTIDQGFTGEVMIHLFNLKDKDYWVTKGDKIAQLVISQVRYEPVEIVDEIHGGDRGDAGYGSTGVR